ncbi:MAG: hypothetical protein WC783_00295 [Candidatus Paceibacterota bacterium]|jgi:hypothetical protein
MSREPITELSVSKILAIAGTVLAVFFFSYMGCSAFTKVDAGEIVVIQHPFDGDLKVALSPGLKWTQFGKSTTYKKSFQYWFSKALDQGNEADQSIKVRFNDGGHAFISGGVRIDLPLDELKMIQIHTRLGSQFAIEHELIRPVVEKSIYMTGPLMSSKESYAEKRNDLIAFIEDQSSKGVYKTIGRDVKINDPMTGIEKTVTVVDLVKDNNGNIKRQEESPITTFGLKMYALSLTSIDYDATVETQIKSQQEAIMQVQTAMANAKKAEQDAITAEKNGQANAAKAKWAQEVDKATAVTKAQQNLEVATLDKQAAEQEKTAAILRGQGEAEARKLIMNADGALAVKLEAWKAVNNTWATQIANYKGAWVPGIVMGSTSGSNNAAMNFMDLMMAKTARDLNLEFKANK